MDEHQPRSRRCSVYRGRGLTPASSVELLTPPQDQLPQRRTLADCIPLHQIMQRDVICARPDLDVAAVTDLMIRHHVGCIPVVDERRHPIGVITKFDVVEQIHATLMSAQNGSPLPQDIQARCAEEVMMPLALTLFEHATISHAAAMMMTEDTHHVIVVSTTGELVGVVSSLDIVGWLVRNDGELDRREAAERH